MQPFRHCFTFAFAQVCHAECVPPGVNRLGSMSYARVSVMAVFAALRLFSGTGAILSAVVVKVFRSG